MHKVPLVAEPPGAPDPFALQESILKEEKCREEFLAKLKAGEDLRKVARLNPKEFKYLQRAHTAPSFRSMLTRKDQTLLAEFRKRPRQAQIDIDTPYSAIFSDAVRSEYQQSFCLARIKSSSFNASLPERSRPITSLRESFDLERLSRTPFAVVLAEPLPESTLRSSFTLKELQFRRCREVAKNLQS